MICASFLALALVAAPVPLEKPKANPLTPKEITEGWIMLFDGETTFGWDAKAGDLPDAKKPEVTVKAGNLRISGTGRGTVCCTTPFPEIEVELEFRLIEGEPGYRPLVGLDRKSVV